MNFIRRKSEQLPDYLAEKLEETSLDGKAEMDVNGNVRLIEQVETKDSIKEEAIKSAEEKFQSSIEFESLPQNSFSLDLLKGGIGASIDIYDQRLLYYGNFKEAIEDLGKLKAWLGSRKIELILANGKTSFELQKKLWYSPAHFIANWNGNKARELITSIAEKVILNQNDPSETSSISDAELKELINDLILPLANYLSIHAVWKSYEILDGPIEGMEVIDKNTFESTETTSPINKELVKPFSNEIQLLDTSNHFQLGNYETTANILKKIWGIDIDLINCMGSGAAGRVFLATHLESDQTSKKYALKIMHRFIALLSRADSPKEKWWRDLSLSASRLNIRNLVKTFLVILEVETKNGSLFFSLPPSRAKEIGKGPIWKRIQQIDPKSKVYVSAELMEQVSGSSLKNTRFFKLEEKAFRDFLNGCCCFIEDAFYSNFSHLDLSDGNIYFDEEKGAVSIIDTGFSARGARRYSNPDEYILKNSTKTGEPLTNPTTFRYTSGTSGFRGIKQRLNQEYGGEVNADILGKRLLKFLIRGNSDAYEAIKKIVYTPPKTFLASLLELLPEEDELVKNCKQYPEFKEIIEWSLELGRQNNDEDTEKIFKIWQKKFHDFQERYGYDIREDFSKKI